MKIKGSFLPLFTIVAGILFLVYLQAQIPEGVYFSGDAGLKSLLAQQLSMGEFRFYLLPPSESWVQQLWSQGLYPYEEPFFYDIDHRYYITFPFSFPLITAPFYHFLGYRGLYVIPFLSTLGIWAIFYRVCLWLKFNSLITSLALILLIFGSPLTIYSAMYWEHTLAVFLIFAGTFLPLIINSQSRISNLWIIFFGCLLGFSVWLRPECLCAILLVLLLIYFSEIINFIPKSKFINHLKLNLFKLSITQKNLFSLSTIVAVSLFFICNQLIYHHYLGIHGIQVIEKASLTDRLTEAITNFKQLSQGFIQFFPIAAFSCLILAQIIVKKNKVASDYLQIIIGSVCLLFIMGVSLIVPGGTAGLIPGGKQWGTRFLLSLIPLISAWVIYQFNYSQKINNKILKNICVSLFTILLTFSIYTNIYSATSYLIKSHNGVTPSLEFLREDDHKIIIISHQFVGQILEPALKDKKIFLKADTEKDLKFLSSVLLNQGYQEFIYICYSNRPCELPNESTKNLSFQVDNKWFIIHFKLINKFGKYPIYTGSLEKVDR
ncbi:LA_3751/LA_3752 family putative glycosyltransferase [Crocosphaera sp. XPORK-15E]|uniref:LA_3751/LA_3752 family putative glycosyltransferase n=1 Tax=Crocosphaera sp. XPORK-15E TaxID=3110247 RepID=UPI002B2136AB|nr:hypothetical protein [Crocosphaera sp. XPORK-15E]MEA5534175.1 hypothetical protein [Crocosphaera sp. XPORK-15E]